MKCCVESFWHFVITPFSCEERYQALSCFTSSNRKLSTGLGTRFHMKSVDLPCMWYKHTLQQHSLLVVLLHDLTVQWYTVNRNLCSRTAIKCLFSTEYSNENKAIAYFGPLVIYRQVLLLLWSFSDVQPLGTFSIDHEGWPGADSLQTRQVYIYT